MRHLITALFLMAALLPGVAQAKRAPAPKVEPVVSQGVRYVAPKTEGRRAFVQAWDTKTGKMLWEVTVFRNAINRLLEEDVQWIFIRSLRVQEGKLLATEERGGIYAIDLKTRAVKKLK